MTFDFDTPGGVLCACLITMGCSLQRQTSFKLRQVKASKLHNSGDPDFMAEKA